MRDPLRASSPAPSSLRWQGEGLTDWGAEGRCAGEGGRVGEVCAGGIGEASPSAPSGLRVEEPPTSAPFLLLWTRGDPELSSSVDATVVGAFTSRFLFLSPLVSGPSAGATERGVAEMGSEVASVPEDDPIAHRLLATAISFWRRSLLEVISAPVRHDKGLVHKEPRKQTKCRRVDQAHASTLSYPEK